jgi:hypothetical protein
MSNIDDEIRHALSEDERRAIEELEEPVGLFDMLGMALRGKQAWITWYMWILGFVVFLLGIYAFMQFLDTDDLKTSLGWVLAINVCLGITVTIKVVGFTQMQKLELMREIKRLELRLISSNEH